MRRPVLGILVVASRTRGVFAGRLGDLAVDLVGEVFHLALRPPQRGGLVPEDAPGGPLDALAELLDPLAGVAGGLGRLVDETGVGQLLGLLQGLGDRLLVRLADGVEEVLGQQRLGLLGLAHGASHPLDEVVQLLLLLFQLLLDLLAIGGVAEGPLGLSFQASSFSERRSLVLVELLGLVAHLGQVVGELAGRLLAELVPDVVQLLAGSGTLGERLRARGLARAPRTPGGRVRALLDLLAGLGHAFAVLFVLHPLLQLVDVAEDLLLLFAEPLELPLDLLLGRLVLGGFEGRLQLLQALVQVGLALGQFLEAADDLPRLALLLLLLRELLPAPGSAPRNDFPCP